MSRERFAPNNSIDLDIHDILQAFQDPSARKMRNKVRREAKAAIRDKNESTDSNARNIFREFLVGYELLKKDYRCEYSPKIGSQTPDWLHRESNTIIEVFTCNRGKATTDPVLKTAGLIKEKRVKYGPMVDSHSFRFVIGIHGDIATGLNLYRCHEAIVQSGALSEGIISGFIYFDEDRHYPDEQGRPRQRYIFTYLPNPNATRPINLGVLLN